LSAQFNVLASGTPVLSYQWLWNGVPLAGATQPSLSLPSVQPVDAGFYAVAISNPYGAITSQVAQLTVLRVDFGDAPDDLYPTSTNRNGAHHFIVPSVHLGATIDAEIGGSANATATGDDLSGIDDEDGVRIVGVLRVGQPGLIEVVASTNGFVDAWVDLFQTGLWADPGDQVLVSQPVQPGNELVGSESRPLRRDGDDLRPLPFQPRGRVVVHRPRPRRGGGGLPSDD
jgi:hypothetical protein